MAKNPEVDNSRNHISHDTKIHGDIETNGDLRLDGTLVGTIRSKGKVVLGNTGKVEGEIYCQHANISGEVKGVLSVAELLSLQSSANVEGDIHTGKLAIEPGALFTGSCSMGAVLKDMNSGQSIEQREKTA